MRFKKPAESVQWEIMSRAQSQAKASLGTLGYGGPMDQIQTAISQAIAMAVMEGFKVMMENEYTDADFERDIGLSAEHSPNKVIPK